MPISEEGRKAISRSRTGVAPGNKGMKAMHKDGITKHFPIKEIDKRIKEGWLMGSTRIYHKLTLPEREVIRQKTIDAMKQQKVKDKVMSAVENNKKRFEKVRHREGEITKAEKVGIDILCPIGFIYNQNMYYGELALPYRPDFINYDSKMIVELDGSSHLGSKNRQRDRDKDDFMYKIGFSTYRFRNEFVVNRTDDFISDINIILSGGDVNECVGLYSCKRVPINRGTE